MLALYDSQGNQLRKSRALDRTRLYDSLLRRFVARERGKDRGFDDAEASEKKKDLDIEMQRLGVAALGMYNRRKVHILSSELNEDLKFFNLERSIEVTSGKALTQADLLLGSFVFVHKSKAQLHAGAPGHHEETFAFEFLHNTFGEFLTGDFVLRRALAEVEALKALQENEVLRAQLEQRLGAADGFQREWFASLVYTPLFTRPVVLEMMREWVRHILREKKLAKHDFVSLLDTIVLNQIKRLLNKREMPSIMRKETAQEGYRAPFGDHPLLGHIAIYSLNLILLRVIVSEEPFVLDEDQMGTYEDGARPWDRLTHIWRSWFALDNLNGVTAVMLADRAGSQITVRAKEKFQVAESQNRLQTCLNVAVSLGDNISSGLTGLVLFDPYRDNQLELEDIARRLESERINLEFQIAMKHLLRSERRVQDGKPGDFWESVRGTLERALHGERYEELEHIALSVRRAAWRMSHRGGLRRFSRKAIEAFGESVHPGQACEVARMNPWAAFHLYEAARDIGDPGWRAEFRHRFADISFGRHHPVEALERRPETALLWMQLAREAGGEGFLRHLHPEFFERAFHPRHLLELSERNPEALLAWVQLAREVEGEGFLRHFDPEFFERAFHSRHLLELSERNPEGLLALVQLAREVGGEGFLRHFDPEFFERAFHSRHLLELSERSPEAALALVQLAREVGGERFPRHRMREFFDLAVHPRHLLELSERNPEAALALVQLAREVGGERFRLAPESCERLFHPRRLLQLSELSPEVALAWVELARELGGEDLLRHLGRDLDQALNSVGVDRLLRRKPAGFAVALRLVRVFESRPAAEAVADCLSSHLRRPGDGSSPLAKLPLSAIDDLRWLAAITDRSELRTALVSLLGDNPTTAPVRDTPNEGG